MKIFCLNFGKTEFELLSLTQAKHQQYLASILDDKLV